MENILSSCDDHHHRLLNNIIPEDVLIQILVLLPVLSLLRFKSVCKSWRALIQTSFFIDLHLNTTTTNNKNNHFGTFIVLTSQCSFAGQRSSQGNKRESEAFMLSCGGGGGGEEEEEEELLKLEDLGFPLSYMVSPTFNYMYMVGSINGLICIHETKGRDVYLWNPATRQFRLLPESLTHLEEGIPGDLEQDFVAFGYDVETKDYKVVLISHFRPYHTSDRWISIEEYIFRVQVYSLTTDSWRLLEGIDSLPALPNPAIAFNHGVYLKGRYYFLGQYLYDEFADAKDNMILSFDFTKEVFTVIQRPHDYHRPHTITTYQGEKLVVFAEVSLVESYEIWVLNEHHGGGLGLKEEEEEEVQESWTKLHELYSEGRPRGISNNGEFAFIGTGVGNEINGVYVYGGDKLEVFNLVTKEVKKELSVPQEAIGADVYNQSLVSISGNTIIG